MWNTDSLLIHVYFDLMGVFFLGATCWNCWTCFGRFCSSWANLTREYQWNHECPRISTCISLFWTWRILSCWSHHSKSWVLKCEGPHVSMPRTASNFSKMLKGGRFQNVSGDVTSHSAAAAGQSSMRAVWRCLSRRSVNVGKMQIWILGLTKMLAFRLRCRRCVRKSLVVKHHRLPGGVMCSVTVYSKDAWTCSLNWFLIHILSMFDTFAFWLEESDVDSFQHEGELIHPVSWIWLRWPSFMQLRVAKRKNSWSCERIRRLGRRPRGNERHRGS